jgi:hypothetical protein
MRIWTEKHSPNSHVEICNQLFQVAGTSGLADLVNIRKYLEAASNTKLRTPALTGSIESNKFLLHSVLGLGSNSIAPDLFCLVFINDEYLSTSALVKAGFNDSFTLWK